MQTQLQIERVENCQEWLEINAEKYENKQHPNVLIEDIGVLLKSMAFINAQMPVAKRIWTEKKRIVFEQVIKDPVASSMAPSLVKDYIASLCSKEEYDYNLCERVSRTIFHHSDLLRSCLSAVKEEIKLTNYAIQAGGTV